MKPAIIFSCC